MEINRVRAMSKIVVFATVRFEVIGFHRWPEATGVRAYLGQRHRHKFFVEATAEVYHDDREIEFHDLLDFCKSHFPGGDMGSRSCEQMAKDLVNDITRRFGLRRVTVKVFEDNEVGAEVAFTTG